jgi:hypothetical protein
VVYRWRHSGVDNSWRICQNQVNDFSNNCYRGYETREEAEEEYHKFLAKEAMYVQTMDVEVVAMIDQTRHTRLRYVIIVVLLGVIVTLLEKGARWC